MGNWKIESYKGSVNSNSVRNGVFAARRVLLRALLFASTCGLTLSCADADSGHPPQGAHAGASSASGGGSAEAGVGQAGSPDEAGTGAGTGGSPDAGTSSGGMGHAGAPGSGGHAGGPTPDRCSEDADCDDHLYCNGKEVCRPLSPDSGIKVCMAPEHGPCGGNDCNETTKCKCTDGDHDGDGYYVEGCTTGGDFDCDDDDNDRNPGNTEDCDQHDEDCKDSTVGTLDADGDTFTSKACTNKSYYQPLLFTPQEPITVRGPDCNDDNNASHPGAIEVCDNDDNNCNGQIDEVSGAPGDPHTYYRDLDGDQWGNEQDPLDTLCNFPPPGYALLKRDCDDNNPRINPAREEICDGLDNDCNGTVDQPEKPGDLMFGQPYDGETIFECTGVDGWKVKTCPGARLDCNEKYIDACETVGTTLCHCHDCDTACAFSCGETTCEEISLVSTGSYHTCAIVQSLGATSGGTVACWGRNADGQLGTGDTKDLHQAIRVPDLTHVTALTSGWLHSCAIAAGQRLFCWGRNDFGQLGASIDDTFASHPVEVHQPSPALKVTQVSSGASHTCAILEGGRLVCWGEGASGKLGNNHTDNVSAPTRVQRLVNGVPQFVNDATQVVAGNEHTCLLSARGVECWGDNQKQQLGVSPDVLESTPVARPVPLGGAHVDELSAASDHTCARAGADVYCWGSNLDHELALESGQFGGPTKIPLPAAAVAIATGSAFGCALLNTGLIYCWGSNYFGERGIPDDPPPALPNPIPLSEVTRVFGGRGAHVCAAKSDASVWCWGENDLGELGNGEVSPLPHPAPSRVLALTGSQVCLSSN